MRLVVLGLVVALALVGCRGVASSATGGTPPSGQVAAGARVTGQAAKVVIDRDCSKLEDPGDEYVCLKNDDTRPAAMGSWVLRNVLGRSYNFPVGFTLAPGASVRVHTGAGTNSATDLYWGYTVKPAWEKGDKLTLLSNENIEVFVSELKL